MMFNATYENSDFVVDISRGLKISFPEIDMEYEIAFRAMGGNPLPIVEFTEHWNDYPVTILASHLGLSWDVLAISLLNHVEHAMSAFKLVYGNENHTPAIENAIDIARSALVRWGIDLDSNEFFWSSDKTTKEVIGLGNKFNVGFDPRSRISANMAWAAGLLLKYMRSVNDTSLFVLGASKSRSVITKLVENEYKARVGPDTADRVAKRKEKSEKHWQVRRTMDVASAFQRVQQETPAGEQVNLGRVMKLAGRTR